MSVVLPAKGETPGSAALDRCSRVLRSRWRTASLAAGWRFPSDWALPEVDMVCAAVVTGGNDAGLASAESALAGLARARAGAGTGLAETLSDVAALHAVSQRRDGRDGFIAPEIDATPARLVRLVALAWSDVAFDELGRTEVVDSLTGLATLPYLRTRLAELYRAAAAAEDSELTGTVAPSSGGTQRQEHSLVVVRMDFSEVSGWSRLTGMIVAADALRSAFAGGESLAAIGSSTVAALVPRDGRLASRTLALRRALVERLASDRQLADLDAPRIRVLGLPSTHESACELLDRLAST